MTVGTDMYEYLFNNLHIRGQINTRPRSKMDLGF